MKRYALLFTLILSFLLVIGCSSDEKPGKTKTETTGTADKTTADKAKVEKEAQEFLDSYAKTFQALDYEASKASWASNTDIKPENTEKEIAAEKKKVAFVGKKEIVEKVKALLKHKDQLKPLTAKQLSIVLYKAAEGPATIAETTNKLVEAEAVQNQNLFSFEYMVDGKNVVPNEIDNMLKAETDPARRLKLWEATKEVGKGLKDGLANLQHLRNTVAREMGYSSFFDLEASDYGMKAGEMVQLMDKVIEEVKPLYAQLYTWVKYKLAERYNQPVPDKMPAHWLPNRWSQEWPDIVESVDMDALFKDKTPEWIVQQAERFYVSMGFPKLPQVFWDKSDLYPTDGSRKKNTHASAWHMDWDKDMRSLMSVANNSYWFETTHHELGHVYYYISYSTPQVPLLLRRGANRGFHEGIGDLISIASKQEPYLREIGILTDDIKVDKIKWLLNEALSNVVFMPFGSGVMTHFEYDLYEKNLPKEEFNKRWWEYVEKYQGIVPPTERGEEFCDAATKSHINNDPAQYYDYSVAKLLQYQFHDYICKNILKTATNNANYLNNKEVGKYLQSILSVGNTVDWRKFLKEKTGEDLSARAMLTYFEPLMEFLEKENEGRKIGF
ncbi:MAG: M2 family metallopeptidase [bacterium]|nr:M2 family metallopeptidase [bacterium]